ncbi:hypothetical protein GDO81_025663 [Engystomops pustulosus]|uniref:Uncharacterized protein n=1 Tax=Engystomops pustulosus TaxID=76066 RepID=A0AAV6YS44_ENGPU|nr:hypothetical protein GDO81_025663 [Engystomops pustulosus]
MTGIHCLQPENICVHEALDVYKVPVHCFIRFLPLTGIVEDSILSHVQERVRCETFKGIQKFQHTEKNWNKMSSKLHGRL